MRVALCLPITFRGSTREDLLSRVRALDVPKGCCVLVATDEGDDDADEAAGVLEQSLPDVVVMRGVGVRGGKLLDIYCDLMQAALAKEDIQYFVMWGDDVSLESPTSDFIASIDAAFPRLPCGAPFGCVVLNDTSSPGFPTYPVVARTHFDIFERFVPRVFGNQDADPFIYETYRRYGAARWVCDVVVRNGIGGALGKARYTEVHVDWKNSILDEATRKVQSYLEPSKGFTRVQTIDTITPTYRGDIEPLRRIAQLSGKRDTLTTHHIIVDNPQLGSDKLRAICALEKEYEHVRVRCLLRNSGASEARNRGLDESAADYVLFIDDDVQVPPTLVECYESALTEGTVGPTRCGYVGHTVFNPPSTPYERAVTLSGITYFWAAASMMPTPPWGVTANLLLKRTTARFKTYIKTGGGEDIALCLDTVALTNLPLGPAPGAKALHPWWPDGVFRFFNWTQGDGLLIDDYPRHTYRTMPNAQEVGFLLALCAAGSALLYPAWCVSCVKWFALVAAAEAADDFFCFSMTATPGRAFLLASLIRTMMEYGHLWVHLKRGRVTNICCRFDWFCGTLPGDVGLKQIISALKFCMFATLPLSTMSPALGLPAVWAVRVMWLKY